MQYGQLPGIDKPVARLVQGTIMVNSGDIEGSFALLDGIYALGGTTFDMAHVYGKGDNERTVGRWIHERGLRDKLVLITKGAHLNPDRRRVTPYDITSDLHDSLARLKVDTIDLYLLHRDDPSVPVEPIIDVLNEHQRAGKIRTFGASNWSVERIEAANRYAKENGLLPFVASSPQYSLADQIQVPWPECISISGAQGEAARAYYQKNQMPLFTWSSLAGGFFSGRFTRDNLDSFTDYLDQVCVSAYCYEENFQRLERAQHLADEKGVTLPEIALAYIMNQPLNIFALTGCRTPDEFAANMAAIALELTPDELAWLNLEKDEVTA